MTARPGAGGRAAAVGLVLLASRLALAAGILPAEVRVRSTAAPLPTTTVTVQATPGTAIDDRTVGARPSAAGQGPASTGETFRDEIRLFLPGLATARPTAVEVSDDLVSTVRTMPEERGTTVAIFIRQPVTYTVSRPSAAGEISVLLKGRQPPPGAQAGGRHRPRPAPTASTEQVTIDATELTDDREHNTVIARGAVTITRGVLTLRADEVRYNRVTGVADATGHVFLTDPDTTMEGTSGHFDLNDESGWLDRGGADFSTSGYALTSDKLEKGLGPRYHIENGIFTTCRCGGLARPSWSVGGRTTDVKVNGLAVVRDATFRVKDVPILWLPILTFPALTDRASGFLMPRVGYSGRRGFQYEQPFFWNISKSQDATVALDVETNARIGLLAEYRYMLSREERGSFAGGYWNESIRKPGADETTNGTDNPPQNRWLVLGRANQPLGGNAGLYLDAFAVSDDTLLREIRNFSSTLDTSLRLTTARLTKTRLGVIDTWDGGMVGAEADYYQDLIDPQELAPQRAPYAQAEQSLPLLGNRIVGRLAGQMTNYQRNEGFDGFRGDLSPELFLPFQLGSVLQGSLLGRMHGTMYGLSDNRQVAFVVPKSGSETSFQAVNNFDVLPPLDQTHLRGVGEVQGRLGTEISRVFTFQHWGLEKLRHTIEPDIRYLYVPNVDENLFNVTACRNFATGGLRPCAPGVPPANRLSVFSRGYLFDELDAINHRSFFSYGFTSRLLGRAAGPADASPATADSGSGTPAVLSRELLRFTVRNGFDTSRDINTNSHLADLDLGVRAAPLGYLWFQYDSSLDIANGGLNAQNVTFTLNEPSWVPPPPNKFQSASSLSIIYRFVAANVNKRGNPEDPLFTNSGTQNVGGALYLRLGDYVGFSFGALYDLNSSPQFTAQGKPNGTLGPHFLLRDYLVRIISPCNCWAAEFGVSDTFNPDERLFRFQITLLGLGSFGPATPRRNYLGAQLPTLGLQRPAAIGFPGEGGYF